ncbi:hypothetical protein RJ639_026371, partial [Escallonia herrerae]
MSATKSYDHMLKKERQQAFLYYNNITFPPPASAAMVLSPSILIASLSSLLFLLIVFRLIIRNRTKPTTKEPLNLPPGSFGWPFLGESLALLRANWDGAPERFLRERVAKHGSPQVFKTLLFGERVAVLCGPAGNKFLFGNENKLVAIWWPSSVQKLFGKCLITSVGEEGKWMRKMLLTFLGPDALNRLYISAMDAVTQQHISTHWQGKEEVKVYQTMKLYTFELACRLFMSLEDPKHIEKLAFQFNIFLKGVIEIPLNFPGTRFYSAMRAAAAIRKQLAAIIKQRRVALEQKTVSPSQDLLSHLLASSDENGRFLTEAEIINNVLTLLFAGHDTSSSAITLIMKNLAELPEVYEKVFR